MPEPMTHVYEQVLVEHGLRSHAATEAEKAMAAEIMQLRALLTYGGAAHDIKTLLNVQEQKNRVVAEAITWYRDPVSDYDGWGGLFGAVRELLRITAGGQHGA